MAICSVFWRIDDSKFKNVQEWYRQTIDAVRIAVNRLFLHSGWFEMLCQATGAGRAARGDRKLDTNGFHGASWNIRNSADRIQEGAPFSGHRLPILLDRVQVRHADSKGGVVAQT